MDSPKTELPKEYAKHEKVFSSVADGSSWFILKNVIKNRKKSKKS